MRKRMCRYIGLSSVTLYHGNRSNSKAEWNEALEGAYEVYFEPNFAFRLRGLIRLRFRDNNIVKGR